MLSVTDFENLAEDYEKRMLRNPTANVALPISIHLENFETLIDELPLILCAQLYYVLSFMNDFPQIKEYRNALNKRLGIDPKLEHGSIPHILYFNYHLLNRILSLETPFTVHYYKEGGGPKYPQHSFEYFAPLSYPLYTSGGDLHVAAGLGFSGKIKNAIAEHRTQGELEAFLSKDEYKILSLAAMGGHLKILALLLRAVNNKAAVLEKYGFKMLESAVQSQNPEVVVYVHSKIMEHCGSLEIRLPQQLAYSPKLFWFSLLSAVSIGGNIKVMKTLFELYDYKTEIAQNPNWVYLVVKDAVRYGNTAVLKLLYLTLNEAQQKDIFSENNIQHFHLQEAAKGYHHETLRYVLKKLSLEKRETFFEKFELSEFMINQEKPWAEDRKIATLKVLLDSVSENTRLKILFPAKGECEYFTAPLGHASSLATVKCLYWERVKYVGSEEMHQLALSALKKEYRKGNDPRSDNVKTFLYDTMIMDEKYNTLANEFLKQFSIESSQRQQASVTTVVQLSTHNHVPTSNRAAHSCKQ